MSRNSWLGLVASVVTIGLAVGGLFLVRGLGGDDLTLPGELDGLTAADSGRALEQIDDEERRTEARERSERQRAYNERELSEALGGADVEARSYYDIDSDDGPPVINVVAADGDLGPLLPDNGFIEPETSGFALPLVERVETGDVECLVRRVNPPRVGDDYDDDDAAPTTVLCQRTSGSLSVRVSSGQGTTVDEIAGYVDDVWAELD